MNGAVHSTWLEVLTDPVRVDVLSALSKTGSGSASEIARRCHATERTVKRHLDSLVALGLAHESREGSGSERLGRQHASSSTARSQAREGDVRASQSTSVALTETNSSEHCGPTNGARAM